MMSDEPIEIISDSESNVSTDNLESNTESRDVSPIPSIAKDTNKKKRQMTFSDFSNVKKVNSNKRKSSSSESLSSESKNKGNFKTKLKNFRKNSPDKVSQSATKNNSTTTSTTTTSPSTSTTNNNKPPILGPGYLPSYEYLATLGLSFKDLSSDTDFKSSVLNSHDFVNKIPNSKPIPYAKHIIKIMTFINKFHLFLPADLLDLSFQDFEVGLGLITDFSTENFDQFKLSQKMNLILLSLLKLILSKETDENFVVRQTFDSFIKVKKPFEKPLQIFKRDIGYSFGEPREWSTYEEDPLQTKNLNIVGLDALPSIDRCIFLSSFVSWCLSNSNPIRSHITKLSHLLNSNASFNLDTYYVSRYLINGNKRTKEDFLNICKHTSMRIVKRRKRSKLSNSNKGKDDLNLQYDTYLSIQKNLKNCKNQFEKDKINLTKNYKKWLKVFELEPSLFFNSNPLSDPFNNNNDIFKLRNNEFFISRIPNVGDFYLPRLHTYFTTTTNNNDSNQLSTYKGLLELDNLFDSVSNDEMTLSEIHNKIKKNNWKISLNFKLFFKDGNSSLKYTLNEKDNLDDGYKYKNTWYEISSNCDELTNFLDYLKESLLPAYEEELNKKKIDELKKEEENGTVEKQHKKIKIGTTRFVDEKTIEDPKYIALQNLIEYLDKIYPLLSKLEQVKKEWDKLENIEIEKIKEPSKKIESSFESNAGVRRSTRLRGKTSIIEEDTESIKEDDYENDSYSDSDPEDEIEDKIPFKREHYSMPKESREERMLKRRK